VGAEGAAGCGDGGANGRAERVRAEGVPTITAELVRSGLRSAAGCTASTGWDCRGWMIWAGRAASGGSPRLVARLSQGSPRRPLVRQSQRHRSRHTFGDRPAQLPRTPPDLGQIHTINPPTTAPTCVHRLRNPALDIHRCPTPPPRWWAPSPTAMPCPTRRHHPRPSNSPQQLAPARQRAHRSRSQQYGARIPQSLDHFGLDAPQEQHREGLVARA